MNIISKINRKSEIFLTDLETFNEEIEKKVSNSRFLIIGGAGSIGRAVSAELFMRNPKSLHIVDISENNLVELVRYLRSSQGYIQGDFKTFSVDCGGIEFEALVNKEGPYDYIFNLSALKHVRSEKDPFTLMRMTMVNIFNTLKIINIAQKTKLENFFCVSTDKAANPENMMGASKRIMEMFLMRESLEQNISMARFANVAFSDGSLLHGFNQRFLNKQPISAPDDVMRYFLTARESGQLCLLAGLFGKNREIFFPKLDKNHHLLKFSDIAIRYLKERGYEPFECESENQAREQADKLISSKQWPCFFFKSDTTGEKNVEEFYTDNEQVELDRFKTIGVIKNDLKFNNDDLNNFTEVAEAMRKKGSWTKKDILNLYLTLLPEFNHKEKGKSLDQRM